MGLKKKYKCKRLLIAYFKNDKLYARTNLNQEEKKMFVWIVFWLRSVLVSFLFVLLTLAFFCVFFFLDFFTRCRLLHPPFYDIIASSRSSCLMDQQAWLFRRKSCRTTWRRTLPSPCGSSTNTMPARINTSRSISCATPTITVRINKIKIKTWATFNRKFPFIHPFLIKLNFF